MKKISFLLLIIWMIFIFMLSNQSGSSSTSESNIFVDFIYSIIHIDKDILVVIIRKSAHIFEYFVLFLLMYNYIRHYSIKSKFILSIILCIVYSIFDEGHQLFIEGRSGEVLDVLVDTIGVFLGYILIRKISYK